MDKECKAHGETTKNVLDDKEIPYEVRMKHIIDAYRKDQVKWGKLAEYAKQLEVEVERLKKVIQTNGFFDPGTENIPHSALVIKDLREQIQELKSRLKEQDEQEREIKRLQEQVDSFPLRIHKSSSFKEIIKYQNKYIEELQGLLEENNIPYNIRFPNNALAREGVDKVVASAMEYKEKYNLEYPQSQPHELEE